VPELPDVAIYIERLLPRVLGEELGHITVRSPFVVRTYDPPLRAAEGERVVALRRLGKRIVFELTADLFLVIHLMIAGRLRWRARGATLPGKRGLAAFDFATGTLLLTEEGSRKRASLHLVRGEAALEAHDPGGLEVLEADAVSFRTALRRENRTLKRALTDPRILSGVGNAYSDEILHRAQMSPVQRTHNLADVDLDRLFAATQEVLRQWIDRLRDELGDAFPEKVTAFRDGMAVHGRHGQPCPRCGAPVQRIRYAAREMNYCAPCQTDGKLLADRGLSRLLKEDWPRSIEEMEAQRAE